MTSCSPSPDVREVVKHALQAARAGAPLTEERFLAVVPLPALVSHVLLEPHVASRSFSSKVAAPAGLVATTAVVAAPAASVVEAVPPRPVCGGLRSRRIFPTSASAPTTDSASGATDVARMADEDEVRRRVLERLRVIDRLPPSNANLSTAILLSIESMYADLWAVSDDDDDARRAFASPSRTRRC